VSPGPEEPELGLARFGLALLLSFGLMGLALEALLGFKVSWLVHWDHGIRRELVRLGHAHGALLGLVLIVADGLLAPRAMPVRRRRARPLLAAAALLLPVGFLLGGAYAEGGDPGLGILLVPPGATALLLGLLLLWPRAGS
jgi:hypothetical protein